jgi:hypothetical protein
VAKNVTNFALSRQGIFIFWSDTFETVRWQSLLHMLVVAYQAEQSGDNFIGY